MVVSFFFAGIIIRLTKNGHGNNTILNILKRFELIDFYFIAFAAACILWTVSYNRYMLPVIPYIWYNILITISYVLGRLLKSKEKIAATLFTLFLSLTLLSCLLGGTREVYKRRTNYQSPAQSAFVDAASWINDNTAKDDVIMSKVPAWIYLVTGRHGFEYIGEADPAVNWSLITKREPDYLMYDNMTPGGYSTAKFLAPVLNSRPDSFEKAYTTEIKPETIVYKVIAPR